MKLTWVCLVVVAVAMTTVSATDGHDELLLREAVDTIRESLRWTGQAGEMALGDMCAGRRCCKLSETEECLLDALPEGQSTLVLPGGNTSCIFGEQGSGPFAFQVVPGAKDKVMLYFQGGGACWDKMSTDQGLCSTTAVPSALEGIFDRDPKANPQYADWTVLIALYCSGDMFVGDVTRPYASKEGFPVTQAGQANTQAVLAYLRAQQQAGKLAHRISELSVMGCSAGALAAQAWATYLLHELRPVRASIVSDSYAGVFPPKSVSTLVSGFGTCGSALLTPEQNRLCFANQLTIEDLNNRHLSASPDVAYTFVQSKTDSVQRSFYTAVALSIGQNPILSANAFYQQTSDLFASYNHHPNFLAYLVDGTQHCFTPLPLYFTANPISAQHASSEQLSLPSLAQWVGEMPLQPRQSLSSVCVGGDDPKSVTGCSPQVVPKTFIVPSD